MADVTMDGGGMYGTVEEGEQGVTAANPRSTLHNHTREPLEASECRLSEVVVCIVGEYV